MRNSRDEVKIMECGWVEVEIVAFSALVRTPNKALPRMEEADVRQVMAVDIGRHLCLRSLKVSAVVADWETKSTVDRQGANDVCGGREGYQGIRVISRG
jgi:hypothetical protein